MTRKQKLPGGLEKGLQNLLGKAREITGRRQKMLLDELKENIKTYKSKGYKVNKYERLYRELCKIRKDLFMAELRERDDYLLKPF